MPKHSFLLPPFARGQQHMGFLFVTLLKMSPNGNTSALKGLQALPQAESLSELRGAAPLHLGFGHVRPRAGENIRKSLPRVNAQVYFSGVSVSAEL